MRTSTISDTKKEMKSWYWAGLGLGVVAAASCTNSDLVRCGVGTVLAGNECVPKSGAAHSAGSGNAVGNGTDVQAGKGSTSDDAGSAGDRADAGASGEPEPSAGAGGDSAGNGGDSAGNGGDSAGNGGDAGGGVDLTGLITTELDCGSRDVTGATVLTDPITQDANWSGVIHLPNGLSVRNEPTLTIAPGTKIIIGHNASVEFGYLGSHATIIAKGTIDKPILFCGETDTPGYWAGLTFRSGIKSASVLRNVLVTDGGGTDAGLTMEMPLLVQGVQVRRSGANGVNAAGFAPASSLLVVTGAAKVPIKAIGAGGVQVPPASKITGNGLDVVDIGFTSFDRDVTFQNLGLPYRLLQDAKAPAPSAVSVVTIEPGVVFWLAEQKVLDFGTAVVRALGSAAKPIVFQGLPCAQPNTQCTPVFPSLPPDAADAGGRVAASGRDLRFEYVELRKLGWSSGSGSGSNTVRIPALAVSSSGTLKVDHVKIVEPATSGFTFFGTGKFSTDSNHFDIGVRLSGSALSLDCAQIATLPADTTITPSNVSISYYTSVSCSSVDTPATAWAAAGSPYVFDSVNIASGASVSLQPGTVLRFRNALRIQDGGTLQAIGTLSSKIQFQRDPASEDVTWSGIEAALGSNVQLDYVLVDGANTGVTARGPVHLAHSTIRNCYTGLKKPADDLTDYLSSNVFQNISGAEIATLP